MKKLSILVCLLLVVGLISGCEEKKATVSNRIKIGLNYELSGKQHVYGTGSVQGIKLAVKQINANGGINGQPVELVIKDNKSSAKLTKKIQQELDKECVVTFGPATSKLANIAGEVAEDEGVALLTNSATESSIVEDSDGDRYDYVYQTCFSDIYQGRALGEYAANAKKQKALIISQMSNGYSEGLSKAFQKAFKAKGGINVNELFYDLKQFDANKVLSEMNNQDYDCIFLPCYYDQAVSLIKAIRASGNDKLIICANAFDAEDISQDVNSKYLSNLVYSAQFTELDNEVGVSEFVAAFEAEYHAITNSFSASGYDLMNYVATVIKSGSANPDADKLNDTLNRYKKTYNGICGDIKMNKNHNANKNVKIVELKSGAIDDVKVITN